MKQLDCPSNVFPKHMIEIVEVDQCYSLSLPQVSTELEDLQHRRRLIFSTGTSKGITFLDGVRQNLPGGGDRRRRPQL